MIFKYLQLGLLTISNINGQTLMPKKANTPNTDYSISPTGGNNYQIQTYQETATENRYIGRYNATYTNAYLNADANKYYLSTIDTWISLNYTIVRRIDYNAQENGQTQEFIERTRNAVLFTYKLEFKEYNTINFKIPLQFAFHTPQNVNALQYTVLDIKYLITNSTAGENYYEPTQTEISGTNDEMTVQEYYRQAKYELFEDNTTDQILTKETGTFVYNEERYDIDIDINYAGTKTYYIIGLAELYLSAEYENQNTSFEINSNRQLILTNPFDAITGTAVTAQVTYEIVNIPGLMFDILTMPFTFISMAFNLTIFPNTPYSINISTLFLAILGILVFVMIMRILTKLI